MRKYIIGVLILFVMSSGCKLQQETRVEKCIKCGEFFAFKDGELGQSVLYYEDKFLHTVFICQSCSKELKACEEEEK